MILEYKGEFANKAQGVWIPGFCRDNSSDKFRSTPPPNSSDNIMSNARPTKVKN